MPSRITNMSRLQQVPMTFISTATNDMRKIDQTPASLLMLLTEAYVCPEFGQDCTNYYVIRRVSSYGAFLCDIPIRGLECSMY